MILSLLNNINDNLYDYSISFLIFMIFGYTQYYCKKYNQTRYAQISLYSYLTYVFIKMDNPICIITGIKLLIRISPPKEDDLYIVSDSDYDEHDTECDNEQSNYNKYDKYNTKRKKKKDIKKNNKRQSRSREIKPLINYRRTCSLSPVRRRSPRFDKHILRNDKRY